MWISSSLVYFYIHNKRATTPQVQSQPARTSHIAICERDPQSLGVTGDELHDGVERGPVDRDGARSTKSKHSTSSIRGLRVSPGRFVGL